jgi:hypothetical protein
MRSLLLLGVAIALSPLSGAVAHAGDACVFAYSNSPNWEDPTNWGGGCDGPTPADRRVPNFDDDVVFGTSEFLGLLSSNVSVNSLTVTAGGLSIRPGGHLTVAKGGGVSGAGLSVDGGEFEINGTFVLSMSSYALSASQNGLIIVNAGATLDFSSPRVDQAPPIAYLQTGGILHNYGTITSDDAAGGVVTSGLINDGVVTASLGRMQVFGAPNNAMDAGSGGTGPFAPGAGGTVCLCGPRVLPPAGVNGAGAVEVGLGYSNWSAGNVVVPPGTTFAPHELDVTGPGQIELQEDVTVPVVRLSQGTRTGSGALTVSSQLWLGLPGNTGTVRGTGTTVLATGATGRFSANGGSAGAAFYEGHTFINNGTLIWEQNDNPSTISLNQATLVNNGTLEIDNDSQPVIETTYGGLIGCCGGVLKNLGTITRDKSAGTAQLLVPTEDSGNIQVKTGTLEIGKWDVQGGSGQEIIESGATLQNDYTTYGDATVTKTGGELKGKRGALPVAQFKPSLVILNANYGVNSPFGSVVDASLHVLGNFTIGQGGFLQVSADPTNEMAGPLWVDGNSSLGGIVDVVIPTGYQLHNGDHIPLVHQTQGGTLSGAFTGFVACDETSCGNMEHPPTFTPVYTATDAYLVVSVPPNGSPVVTVANLNAVEFIPLAGTPAFFTDSNGQSMTASDFSATLDWGDGVTTIGVVAGSGTTLSVTTGGHAYTHEGVYTLTVTVMNLHTGASGSGHSQVTVSEGDVLSIASGPAFTARATVPATNVTTATFADSIPQASSDFTATITWGDGTTSVGTVSGGSGSPLLVKGTHTYANAGAVTVTTVLTDDPPGTAHLVASGTVSVAPPPVTHGGGCGVSGGGGGAALQPWFLPAVWLFRRRREKR